jgi:D-glycero-alpha-D-manno-heptose-7-phosphate kinase
MIITKTPFRISFFGGGTDYPDWYKENGGLVISSTIDKFCYISLRYLPPFFRYKYRIRYFKNEHCVELEYIQHPTVKATLKYLAFDKNPMGIEILHNADLPALSGLGSSSTFTVGLLKALNHLIKRKTDKITLANDAIMIEQNYVKDFVGSQDQVAASFGGLNYIKFNKRKISTTSIVITADIKKKIQNNFFLIYTGFQRKANLITRYQVIKIKKKENDIYLNKMMQITDFAYKEIFNQSKLDLIRFSEALNEQWYLKKNLSNNITNKKLDEIYQLGMNNGASAGKLLGAGGGGFFLFVVSDNNLFKFKKKFKNFLNVPFKLENKGSIIIYNKK